MIRIPARRNRPSATGGSGVDRRFRRFGVLAALLVDPSPAAGKVRRLATGFGGELDCGEADEAVEERY